MLGPAQNYSKSRGAVDLRFHVATIFRAATIAAYG